LDATLPHCAPLLEGAREFFTELTRLERAIVAPRRDALGEREAPPTLEVVRRRLLEVIERESRKLAQRGGEFERRGLQEFRYVLAAMADEVLVHLPWPEREQWNENLLEEELFRSHDAGQRFFQNVEALLAERDNRRADVAAVYLLALSLGFQGKYREGGGQGRLEELRRLLFAFAFQREPELESGLRPLCPRAYAHTLGEREDLRLARLWPWGAGITLVFVAWLVAGHVLWTRETEPLVGYLRTLVQPGEGAR
jgi:type VI secretion system protein ImpK